MAAKQHGNPLSLLSVVLDGGLKPRNRSKSSGEGWSSGMLQPTSSGAGGPDEAGGGRTPFFDNLKPPISVMDSVHGSIGSTTRIPILFPNDYELWALHFEDYVLGIEEHGSTVWHAITVGPFQHTVTRRTIKTLQEYNTLLADIKDVPQDEANKLMSNIKAMRIIRFALPPDTFRLVSSYDTAKGIWDRLKELYSGDADLEHSVQTTLLSEFGSFSQNSDEKLDQVFNRYNHLLSRMLKYKLERSSIEQKVTFLNGLKTEWKLIVSTVKAHEQFRSYTLAKLVGILRSHEEEVTKDNLVSGLGSLALVANGKNAKVEDSDSDLSDNELSREDRALMVSNPKKFFKKNFSRFRNRANHGNFSSERSKEDNPKSSKDDEDNKSAGDSGYTCYYCGGKNHLAKHCMLRKKNEQKKEENDEAHYVRKLEGIRKQNLSSAKPAFVVQEDNETGTIEVWSSDSEDEDVRNPPHGRCLMVRNEAPEQSGYATDDCKSSESVFATKTCSEHIKDCENVVNKVQYIHTHTQQGINNSCI